MLSKPMILKRFRPSPDDRTIRDLYGAIVAQARSLAFYTSYDVPDTVQGRFDLIVLHLVLLLARLDRDGDFRTRHRPEAVRPVLPGS
jgi:cytochrome b pre-mRNA-processing protein 3